MQHVCTFVAELVRRTGESAVVGEVIVRGDLHFLGSTSFVIEGADLGNHKSGRKEDEGKGDHGKTEGEVGVVVTGDLGQPQNHADHG